MHRATRSTALAILSAILGFVTPAWCDLPCAHCHPKETAAYLATPMARALGPVTGAPSGEYFHALSKTQFSVDVSNGRMVQRIERNGASAQYDVAFAVGSGAHAFAYMINAGDHLFESPLGYFPGRGWGMSPGYEDQKVPDFYRPVTPDCLFCHAGRAQPVAETFNTYQDPPFAAEGITCERCHGPVEAHLRAPVPGSIINPASLPPRARDSVCEQCHLGGEERVPNPGKQLADFRPGENLEDVYSVYVKAASLDPSRASAFKVVSQVQQLALSVCARRSGGKLWCGTCHDPHVQPADPKAYFRERCLSCHAMALMKTHPKPDNDCIGCHMPRRPVTDGAHTVFTDHRIARRLPPKSAPAVNGAEGGATVTLVAWHDPPGALAERNLGLADVKVGDRLENFALVNQGFQLLMQCWSSFPNDAALLSGLGTAVLASGHGTEAAATFEQVIQLDPNAAVNYLHAGLAWKAAHDDRKAIDALEKSLQLDPLLEQPYHELAAIYRAGNDPAMLRQTYARYLKAFPKSIEAQTAMRDVAR